MCVLKVEGICCVLSDGMCCVEGGRDLLCVE